jgi:beta-galactosidase
LIYLPYPVMLKQETVSKLRAYVEQGGTLVSEGLPAYFGDHGRAGEVQPNYGLDALFGARQSYVEFTPDLLEKLTLTVQGHPIYGRYFLQEFETRGGEPAGQYSNGHTAAVLHRTGNGRTLLIGTFPGAGYYLHHSPEAKAFFAGLLQLAGIHQQVTTNNAAAEARLHTGPGGTHLWVVNPTRSSATVTVSVNSPDLHFSHAKDVWDKQPVSINNRQISVTVKARDAAVIELQ